MVFLALALIKAVHGSPITSISRELLPVASLNQSGPPKDLNEWRTIRDIIWSCFFTIISCTWVSLHPNIPSYDEKWSKVTFRRLGLTVITLFAPELVVAWALQQRARARQLAEDHRCQGWTETHGFFAIMGGFMAFDDDRPIKMLEPDELKGYSLLGNDDFPKIDIKDIMDKSKGNVLSKALVVFQTGWFITQCIARAAQNLHPTELETVTLAYAVLNFGIYYVWWHKPLNVQRSVRVYKKRETDESVRINAAYDWKEENHGKADNDGEPDKVVNFVKKIRAGIHEHGWMFLFDLLVMMAKALSTFPLTVVREFDHDNGAAFFNPIYNLIFPEQDIAYEHGRSSILHLDGSRISASVEDAKPVVTGVAMLFGAIHCVAWFYAFPSDTERVLWRVSSIGITGLSIGMSSLGNLAIESEKYSGFFFKLLGQFLWLVTALMVIIALPIDAYRSVRWAAFIPHV